MIGWLLTRLFGKAIGEQPAEHSHHATYVDLEYTLWAGTPAGDAYIEGGDTDPEQFIDLIMANPANAAAYDYVVSRQRRSLIVVGARLAPEYHAAARYWLDENIPGPYLTMFDTPHPGETRDVGADVVASTGRIASTVSDQNILLTEALAPGYIDGVSALWEALIGAGGRVSVLRWVNQ